LRYHAFCMGQLGGGAWSIQSRGADALVLDDSSWAENGTFLLRCARSTLVTEGRIHDTWRHHHCDIYRAGELIVQIATSLRFGIRARFIGEVPGPDVLAIDGCFIEQNYRFMRCMRTVANVSTVWDGDGSGFAIEVREDEDQAMIVACALAIRALCGPPARACVLSLPSVPRAVAAGHVRTVGAQG
jgi:hypothetical protein